MNQLVEAEANKKRADVYNEIEKLKQKYVIQSDIIELHVGHRFFTTKLSTLLVDEHSDIAKLFSGSYELAKDENGKYFLDRDPEVFQYILSYLRNHLDENIVRLSLPSPRLDTNLFHKIQAEAKFFNLNGLNQIMTNMTTSVGEDNHQNDQMTTQRYFTDIKKLSTTLIHPYHNIISHYNDILNETTTREQTQPQILRTITF